MWVATKDGFYSVVEHRRLSDHVIVRARVRADLEAAFGRPDVEYIPEADYPYRILMPKWRWAQYVSQSALAIDYPNFKASIQDQHRQTVYMRVWAVLRGLGRPDQPHPTLFAYPETEEDRHA